MHPNPLALPRTSAGLVISRRGWGGRASRKRRELPMPSEVRSIRRPRGSGKGLARHTVGSSFPNLRDSRRRGALPVANERGHRAGRRRGGPADAPVPPDSGCADRGPEHATGPATPAGKFAPVSGDKRAVTSVGSASSWCRIATSQLPLALCNPSGSRGRVRWPGGFLLPHADWSGCSPEHPQPSSCDLIGRTSAGPADLPLAGPCAGLPKAPDPPTAGGEVNRCLARRSSS
jgi:hypothetical protein